MNVSLYIRVWDEKIFGGWKLRCLCWYFNVDNVPWLEVAIKLNQGMKKFGYSFSMHFSSTDPASQLSLIPTIESLQASAALLESTRSSSGIMVSMDLITASYWNFPFFVCKRKMLKKIFNLNLTAANSPLASFQKRNWDSTWVPSYPRCLPFSTLEPNLPELWFFACKPIWLARLFVAFVQSWFWLHQRVQSKILHKPVQQSKIRGTMWKFARTFSEFSDRRLMTSVPSAIFLYDFVAQLFLEICKLIFDY